MEILGIVNIPVWLILLLCSLLLLYVYGTWTFSVWTSQGIPGPKPWPLVGNLKEELQKGTFRVFTDWTKKYGRKVGHFRGVVPQLTVTDLDFVREVYIKNSHNFIDRNQLEGFRPRVVSKAVLFAQGTTWKRIRSMMTPMFSTSKLKSMSGFINRCTNLLVGSIEKKARADEAIDIKDVFGAFTMDVIAGTGFGLETNSQTEVDEPFVRQCKALFKRTGLQGLRSLFFVLGYAFPFVSPALSRLTSDPTFFLSAVEKMVDERREENLVQKKKSPDLLQMLVDAEADPENITDLADDADDSKSNRRLTKEEIMAQGFIVLVAGYETTATSLHYLTYNLTLNPDIQEKVYQELRDELGGAEPTYENLSQLKYLDMAIRENLRFFPPASIMGRKALEDTTIQGVNIPKGCGIIVPIVTILHDPEYFPNPDVFDPERFSEENITKIHPVTLELAFGYGPRKCIGMRLALLEIKFAAAKLFQRFRFVKCSETPEKITFSKRVALAQPEIAVKVKAQIREA